ncbi:hypothetical protein NE236_31180 [Actinoallomurus purpureus]|uniref:hypothetical protein n=1 Tax=Actinoallomurus purpureus TaxID=478114 RepID=UPI0020938BEF|nr:hypothetical protein [Actinoallomurus purpureus]MCO6009443.1 hypothetical protein [Actinoallomurus purpureus]
MTRSPRPGHRRRSRPLGGKRKYAAVWLLVTSGAMVTSYCGIQEIYATGGETHQALPVVAQPSPPTASTTPAAASRTPSPRPPQASIRPRPTPTRSRPAALPTTTAAPTVTITAPPDQAKVNGRAGVLVHGRVGDLRGDVLRIFVYAPDGRFYLTDNGPVQSRDGQWSSPIQQIGDGTRDIGRFFKITAVRADATCQDTIQGRSPDVNGNIAFLAVPPGCAVADEVAVLKTAWN